MKITDDIATPADRAQWAELWTLAREPWKDDKNTAELAEFLGPARTTLAEWCTGGANAGAGPWALLRLALRRTAKRYPEAIPALGRALLRVLLDEDVVVVRVVVQRPLQHPLVEALEATGAAVRLAQAVQRGDPREVLVQLADECEREARDVRAAVAS